MMSNFGLIAGNGLVSLSNSNFSGNTVTDGKIVYFISTAISLFSGIFII